MAAVKENLNKMLDEMESLVKQGYTVEEAAYEVALDYGVDYTVLVMYYR